MKVQAGNADAFLRRPPTGIRGILIYGPDAGAVAERSQATVAAALDDPNDPFRRTDLLGSELAGDTARLADEMASQSLLGGRRVVMVRDAADSLAPAVSGILDGPETDNLLVVAAGDLGPRSPLRKLFEGKDRLAAVPCYLGDAQSAATLAREIARQAGMSLEASAEAWLGERLAGDRMLARREIEKLIAYMGEGDRITLSDAEAVVGDAAEQSLDELAMAVADGDLAGLERALARLTAEGVPPVAILRTVQRHFQRLHLALGRVEGGMNRDEAVAKMNLFFKIRARVGAQVRRWSLAAVEDALARLGEAETQSKSTDMPAATLTARTLLAITVTARRQGRGAARVA